MLSLLWTLLNPLLHRGSTPLLAAALELAFFLAPHGRYCHHRGGSLFFPPIVYKRTQVPEHLCAVLSLNSFISFVVAYQDVLLYNTPLPWAAFTGILGVGACALLGGLLVFSHFRWSFAEEV
jgi:hypothetical protein